MIEQFEFFEIPSPCIRVCQTDAKGVCMGCFRNRTERFEWLNYSNAQKRDIIRLTKQRYVRFLKAKREMQLPTPTEIKGVQGTSQLVLFDE